MADLRFFRSFPASVVFVAASRLPTSFGEFAMHGLLDEESGKEHVALSMGDIADDAPVFGCLHFECLTGDALFSLRCDCGFQLEGTSVATAEEGRGVLFYLRQEGHGIGLLNKIRAYELQDAGADTVEANLQLGFSADQRDYAIYQPMLVHLGVPSPRLMTNNPCRVKALESYAATVAERMPLQRSLNKHNRRYLTAKAGKLEHMLGSLYQGEAETT